MVDHEREVADLRGREPKYADTIKNSDRLDQLGGGPFYMGRIQSNTLLPAAEWEVLSYIAQSYPLDSTIVEIGCGWGQLLAMASAIGYSAIGLDTAASRIEGAKYLRNVVDADFAGAASRLDYFVESFPGKWRQTQTRLAEIKRGPVIGFFSNLGYSTSEEFCDSCIAAFGHFDHVVMDIVRFFSSRLDEASQNDLIRRMAAKGVNFVGDVYHRPGAYRFIALTVDHSKLQRVSFEPVIQSPFRYTSTEATLSWIGAVKATGGAVSAERAVLIDCLIRALGKCGAWKQLDRLWVFAAENEAQALTDLVTGSRALAFNAPAFTVNRGFVFDGKTQYIDTGFNAAASESEYSRDSASYGGFVFGASQQAGGIEFGNDYGGYSMMMTNSGAARTRFQVNAASDLGPYPNKGVLTGHFHGQRISPDQTVLYVDGMALGATRDRSQGVPNQTFFVGAGQGSGGACNFSTAAISTAHIGGSLPSDEGVSEFDQVIRSFIKHLEELPK